MSASKVTLRAAMSAKGCAHGATPPDWYKVLEALPGRRLCLYVFWIFFVRPCFRSFSLFSYIIS